MIIFGLVLLMLSIILKTSIVWTIGIIMLIVDAVLLPLAQEWVQGQLGATMVTEIPGVPRHPSGGDRLRC